MNKQNTPVLTGSILVLLGLFFGWVGLRSNGLSMSVSGWAVLSQMTKQSVLYYLVYLLPLGALAAACLALVDRQAAALVGVTVSGVVMCWIAFKILQALYMTTFVGLWLSLLGVCILFFGGLATLKD